MLCSEPANDAVTELAALKVTLQVVVPVHPPDQLENVLPAAGVSVSVMGVPAGNVTEQPVVAPLVQLIPAGLLVTVPVPPPAVVTVNTSPVRTLKVAVTVPFALRVGLQIEVPEQPSPVQPPNEELLPGVEVSVTGVFGVKLAEQPAVEPAEQLIPAGLLMTIPAPTPTTATVNSSSAMNDALALAAAVSVIVQVVVIPEQAPLQPPKTSLVPGVSVSVTFVFWGKLAVQVPGQLISAGVLVMVPAPAGGAVTVSWKVGVDGVDGELDPMPPQPASSRVKNATNNTHQNP
jgi:hypothetical protein